MEINFTAVARVSNSRVTVLDDHWADIIFEIILEDHIPEQAFQHISAYSHLEIIYFFDQVDPLQIVFSGRPRGNPDFPEMGIFGQRKKNRPNRIGLSTVELIAHEGRLIRVKFLDAIIGTPVLDIKPVFREFCIIKQTIQPIGVEELIKNYW